MPIIKQFRHLRDVCVWFVLSLILQITPAHSAEDNLCDRAAVIVAKEVGIPLKILRAISRTETGRISNGRLEPWPWAVNVEGKGIWSDTRVSALQLTQRHLSSGKQNIDIGCFQLNYRWHGDAFASVSDMFDPLENARYAARFLSALFVEKGDWISAAGAYHSRTREHAARYQRKFSKVLSELGQRELRTADAGLRTTNENRFPLLRRTDHKPLRGSLVPLGQTVNRSLLRHAVKGG